MTTITENNTDVLIKLKDTDITNIKTIESFTPGTCDTCDYGEKYLYDVKFETADNQEFNLNFDNRSSFTIADFTKLIIENLDYYQNMTFTEFKQELDDYLDRNVKDIQAKLSNNEKLTSYQPEFANKDVYALVQDVSQKETKVLWDIRGSKHTNDELISGKAQEMNRTAIKIISNGQPTYEHATYHQLREVPRSTYSGNKQLSIVRDTFKHVQHQMNLSDYNLQKSLSELKQDKNLQL